MVIGPAGQLLFIVIIIIITVLKVEVRRSIGDAELGAGWDSVEVVRAWCMADSAG